MDVRGSSYTLGQWKAACQRCGREFKNVDIRLEWTGLRVCKDCHDPRHPQDYVRGKTDRQAPPWVSPKPGEIDVSVGSGNEVSADDL